MRSSYIVQLKQGKTWFDSSQNSQQDRQSLRVAKRVYWQCLELFGNDVRIVRREYKDTVVKE